MSIRIFTTTPAKIEDTLLYKSLEGHDYDFHYVENNTHSLPKQYNQAIKQADKDGIEILVLCHSDVKIRHDQFLDNIQKGIEKYDIVGVAGTKECVIKNKNLWHLMNNSRPFYRAVGSCAHLFDGRSVPSFYGPTPSRALLIDGVFMAVNVKKIVKKDVWFDEENPAIAHFYDLDFCLTANKNKIKMGVYPIYITHASPGLQSYSDEWVAGNDWFKTKWSSQTNQR